MQNTFIINNMNDFESFANNLSQGIQYYDVIELQTNLTFDLSNTIKFPLGLSQNNDCHPFNGICRAPII